MKKTHTLNRLFLTVLLVFISFVSFSQNTGSLPYWAVMLPKASISGTDSCAVFDNATLKWKKTNCAALGDLYVKKLTGNVLFDFPDASSILLSTDNGVLAEGILSINPSASILANSTGYVSVESDNITLSSTKGIFELQNDIKLTDSRVGVSQVGLEYDADYSANYTDRSLVDKEYVDDFVDSLYVKKLTGDVLFDFISNNNLDITTDSAGYLTGWLSLSNTAAGLGFGDNNFNATSTGLNLVANDNIIMQSDNGFVRAIADDYISLETGSGAARLKTTNITSDKTFEFPDASGTLALSTEKLSQFASTTSAELAGVLSDETGSGSAVFSTSPTLTTPDLGVASATSINKVILTAPATTATLTLANNTTTSVTGGGTIGLGGFNLTVPATGTAALLGTANVFTATQSFTANVIPTASNTYDVGANTSTGDWRNMYVRTVQPADVTTTNTAGTSSAFNSGLGNGSGAASSITFGTPTVLGGGGGAQSLTTRLTINSTALTPTVQVRAASGSQAAPSYSFSGATSTGLYLNVSNVWMSVANTNVMNWANTGVTLAVSMLPSSDNSYKLGDESSLSWSSVVSRVYTSGSTLLIRTREFADGTSSSAVTVRTGTTGTGTSGAVTLTTGAAGTNNGNSGNLVLSTGTITGGTGVRGSIVIGNATTIPMGFWNATPITQPANTVAIDDVLINTGLRASGGTANFTLGIKPAAGTTALAPITFTAGTLKTSVAAGDVEFDGTDFYASPSTTRHKIARVLTGSATLDFPSTLSTDVADLTITVTGAAVGDPVIIGVPNGSVTATSSYTAWVSAADTVTIRYSPKATEDPASGTFKVSVSKN
jgi:hypothetical protein